MYIFASLFKVYDHRIKYSADFETLTKMMIEVKKEMMFRLIMAYFVAVTVFSAVCYYIIRFSSLFGWKTSWAWFYSGCGAVALNFTIYDFGITTLHWIVIKIIPKLGMMIATVRNIKQAREEA